MNIRVDCSQAELAFSKNTKRINALASQQNRPLLSADFYPHYNDL